MEKYHLGGGGNDFWIDIHMYRNRQNVHLEQSNNFNAVRQLDKCRNDGYRTTKVEMQDEVGRIR
jgi:hypothetical protein